MRSEMKLGRRVAPVSLVLLACAAVSGLSTGRVALAASPLTEIEINDFNALKATLRQLAGPPGGSPQPATLLIESSITIPSTLLEIPDYVTLRFTGAADFHVDVPNQVIIYGPVLAPNRQIFTGTGKIWFWNNDKKKNRSIGTFPAQWWGVRGIGLNSADDTQALKNAIDAIPNNSVLALGGPGFNVHLTDSIKITNREGLKIVGISASNSTAAAQFTWIGAKGGTVFDCQGSRGVVFENFSINLNNIASVGINMDQDPNITSATMTDSFVRRVMITSGGPAQDDYVGIRIAYTSHVNVENIRIQDVQIYGAITSNSNFGTGTGIQIGGSGGGTNAFGVIIHGVNIRGCNTGVHIFDGNVYIEEGFMSRNAVDFLFDGGVYTQTIKKIHSEDFGQFIVARHLSDSVIDVEGNRLGQPLTPSDCGEWPTTSCMAMISTAITNDDIHRPDAFGGHTKLRFHGNRITSAPAHPMYFDGGDSASLDAEDNYFPDLYDAPASLAATGRQVGLNLYWFGKGVHFARNFSNSGSGGSRVTSGSRTLFQSVSYGWGGFTDGSTNPDVQQGRNFLVPFTLPAIQSTVIDNFENGAEGQEIVLLFRGNLTTIHNGGHFQLSGEFQSRPGAILKLVLFDGIWYEVSRSMPPQ